MVKKILNARVIDGTGAVLDRVDIELDGTKFGAITPSAEHASKDSANPDAQDTLDLGGKTVIPGLFNCHIHLTISPYGRLEAELEEAPGYRALLAINRAKEMLKSGITTARDLGGKDYVEMSVKRAINEGMFPGTRLLVSGKVLTMTGGHGSWIGAEVDGIDEVRKAARYNIKMGADCIKMMATGGVMTPNVDPNNSQLLEEEMAAGFEEAHKAGKLSASHAQGTAGIKNAVRAGVRTIEHGVYLDDEVINMMIERGTYLVPTLAAPKQIADAGLEKGVPKFMVDKSLMVMEFHINSAIMAYKAGVRIACGSDAGTPYNPHNDIFTEMYMLSQIGMSNMEVLMSATMISAQAMKLDKNLGTIQPGMLADFLVLSGDPLVDLAAVQSPEMVWKEGSKVF